MKVDAAATRRHFISPIRSNLASPIKAVVDLSKSLSRYVLDTFSNLYKRVGPSVRPSVHPSVHEHESKSVKTRNSALTHPSTTAIGCVSGLDHHRH